MDGFDFLRQPPPGDLQVLSKNNIRHVTPKLCAQGGVTHPRIFVHICHTTANVLVFPSTPLHPLLLIPTLQKWRPLLLLVRLGFLSLWSWLLDSAAKISVTAAPISHEEFPILDTTLHSPNPSKCFFEGGVFSHIEFSEGELLVDTPSGVSQQGEFLLGRAKKCHRILLLLNTCLIIYSTKWRPSHLTFRKASTCSARFGLKIAGQR